MALFDKQADDGVFHAHAHIYNHMYYFINSFSLKCAVQLGIPDIIHEHEKPMPLSDLVEALSINKAKSDNLHRLMQFLIHSGFFKENAEGYELTPVAHYLLKDHPFSTTPTWLTMLDPIVTEPWHQLSEWFKTDGQFSLFESSHGKALWEFNGEKPVFNHSFNEAMASDARMVSNDLLTKQKEVFEGLDSIVDVAGGTGTLAMEIAKAFPNMSCIVLDLPHVVEGLKGTMNLTFVAGDMFQSLPTANAFLFKSILHDWTDDKCVEILKRCKESLPTEGKVVIIDMVVDNERNDVGTQLLFDMLLMTLVNGKERNEKQWEKLFIDAGFTNYRISHHVLGMRSLIEVYP